MDEDSQLRESQSTGTSHIIDLDSHVNSEEEEGTNSTSSPSPRKRSFDEFLNEDYNSRRAEEILEEDDELRRLADAKAMPPPSQIASKQGLLVQASKTTDTRQVPMPPTPDPSPGDRIQKRDHHEAHHAPSTRRGPVNDHDFDDNASSPDMSAQTYHANSIGIEKLGQEPESQPPEGHSTPEHSSGDLGESDPLSELEPFDWHFLERKYETMIEEKEREIDEVWADYEKINRLFIQWTSMAGERESSRLYKRHKTQQAFVQQKEEDVDQLRQKYTRVVDAFKSAMDLLD